MGAESISIELEIEEYIGGGGSGTNNYNQLSNKPQINGVALEGNKTSTELGINNEVDNALSKTSTNPVQNAVITEELGKKSPVDSPEFTGVPKVPTAIQGTKTTQAASTEFVMGAVETKADKTEIPMVPQMLPNPHPVTFGGIIPEVSYDGSQAINIMFPDAEMMDEVVGTPVGEIISYMGNTAPANYLKCDGAVYNIADYSELAQHFAVEFGTSNHFGGDGETTFAVPDLRGEFLRGTGTNSHNDGGDGQDVGSHQGASRLLAMQKWKTNALYVGNPSAVLETSNYDKSFNTVDGRVIFNASGTTNGIAPTGVFAVRPTNTSVLYCIKYKSTHFIRVGGG